MLTMWDDFLAHKVRLVGSLKNLMGLTPVPVPVPESRVIATLTHSQQQIIVKLLAKTLQVFITAGVGYLAFTYLGDLFFPESSTDKANKARAKDMLKRLGISGSLHLTRHEQIMASSLVSPEDMDVDWDDIGGLEEEISEVKVGLLLPFTRPDLFNSSTFKSPSGLLLHGPPGCGKTMLAKCIAKDAKAHFLELKVSTLHDKYYGESPKRLDAVFTLAKKIQPCIIFIDEADAFMRSRDFTTDEHSLSLKTQFMTFWDGLCTDKDMKIMIIAATNRINDIDPALLRRMVVKVYVGLPNSNQREKILRLMLSRENCHSDVEPNIVPTLLQKTSGMSGNDIKLAVRGAVTTRMRHITAHPNYNEDSSFTLDSTRITIEDLLRSFDNVSAALGGKRESSRSRPPPLD